LPYTWGDGVGRRQTVISRATMPTLLRVPLVSAFITGLQRLLPLSRSSEATFEEERTDRPHQVEELAGTLVARLGEVLAAQPDHR